jgi:O-antigen/teichoic acid export membrane protein
MDANRRVQRGKRKNNAVGRGGMAGDMIRGSLWTLVTAVTGVPVAFAVNLVVARALGPSGYGRIATYAAVVGVATIVLNLGISQATVQWIAEMQLGDFGPKRLNLIRNCVGYHALLEGPAAAAVVFFMLRDSRPWVWIGAGLAMLATCAIGTSSVILTASARNSSAAKIALAANLALQATTIVVALATRSANATYGAMVIAGVLGPAMGYFLLRSDDRRAFFHPLVLKRLPAGFVRYGFSACGAALVGTLVFGRSEIFVLQWHGLSFAAGIFALATGLSGQITIPMDSVMGPLLPTATRLLAAAPARATETASRSLRVTSVLASFTMATAIPTVYIAIPLLFGRRFELARSPFLLLGLVSCLQSVTVPLSMLVYATRKASSVLRINLICVAVDAGLAVGLVPVLGLWGAVIANSAAQVLSLGLLIIVAVREVGIDAKAVYFACRPLILGLAAAGLAVMVALLVPAPIGVLLIVAPLIGFTALAIGFRRLPTWAISAVDGALVEASLPVWLRIPYRWIARIFSIVAALV